MPATSTPSVRRYRRRWLAHVAGTAAVIASLAATACSSQPVASNEPDAPSSSTPSVAAYDLSAPVGDGSECAAVLVRPVLDALTDEGLSFEPTQVSDAIADYCRQDPSGETVRHGVRWVLRCLTVGTASSAALRD